MRLIWEPAPVRIAAAPARAPGGPARRSVRTGRLRRPPACPFFTGQAGRVPAGDATGDIDRVG